MTYASTRIGAAVAMRVEDYYSNGKRIANKPPSSARQLGKQGC